MSVIQMASVFKHSLATGGARLVLLALADVANDEGEVSAYARSQKIIGQKAKLSERSVRASIKTLVDLGELEVLARGDGRKSTDYRILLSESRAEAAAPPGRKDVYSQGGTSSPPRAEAAETPISPSSSVSPRPSPSRTEMFDEFWRAYPRRVGKRKAVDAYEQALKRADSETILAGVLNLAALGAETQFTPHPTTWLNRDGWEDDHTVAPRMPRGADATARTLRWMQGGGA